MTDTWTDPRETSAVPDDPAASDAPPQMKRGGWRLMREVALLEPRYILLGVSAALGWTLAKITIPLLALQAINDGIDPYNGAALAKWTALIVAMTLITGTLTYFRRSSALRRLAAGRGRAAAPVVRPPAAAALRVPRPRADR